MTVAIAAAALAVSLTALLMTRRRDRRDLLLRIHERLASVEQQQGRRLIHQLLKDQAKDVRELEPGENAQINNALATLNVACLYWRRHYVRQKDLRDLWAAATVRAFDAARPFLAYREAENDGTPLWPELYRFVERYRSHVEDHRLRADPESEPPRQP